MDFKHEAEMDFTHFDDKGNARMVDVSEKADTARQAVAKGKIKVSEAVFRAVSDKRVAKGDVLTVATTAGIMGAKNTFSLIPMCHILQLTKCAIDWELVESCSEKSDEKGGEKSDEKSSEKGGAKSFEIRCTCTVKCTGKTGVEMEALTGVSIALLTVYDMCKAIDKTMEISEIYLAEKEGGKSGHIVNKVAGGHIVTEVADGNKEADGNDEIQSRNYNSQR